MFDLCLFAGTSEGRRLAEALADTTLRVLVCVATEYGESLIPQGDHIAVHTGRLDRPEMTELFKREGFSMIVDATHPFAVNVTENIVEACRETGVKYLRLVRKKEEAVSGDVYTETIAEAASYLKEISGNVLVTTGSKELSPYTEIPDYQERLYVRVLPMQSSLEACEASGIKPSHIIAMQGPFSPEMNRALIRMTKARYLVTKDSGTSGGFEDKIRAAAEEGITSVIIGRPMQISGVEYAEAFMQIAEYYNISIKQRVSIVGIGMGASSLLTAEAKEVLDRAECIIGATRAVEAVAGKKPVLCSMDNTKILEYIRMHPKYREIAVVMTGDTGFYSGTRKLLPLLKEYEPRVYPGISSLQYFCARLGLPWDDVFLLSLHGREGSAVPAVAENQKVFLLVGGAGGVKHVLEDLCANGFGEVQVSVGEQLSYPQEKISSGTAGELCNQAFDPLSVMLIRNKKAKPARYCAGLPDEAFLRNTGTEKNVPMTKSEIRAVSVAKLMLEPDSIVYDVGSGTGSVSVEMAHICTKGWVYAIECKPEAAALTNKNKSHFGIFNMTVVEGTAPEACETLPPPTHAFIGGTSGNMYEILQMLLAKNPQVRIVMNLIALESIAEAMRCLEAFSFDETEVVQISAAKAKKLGRYHLMNGQNPITIITCQKHDLQERAEEKE